LVKITNAVIQDIDPCPSTFITSPRAAFRRLSPPRLRANMSLDARSSFIFKAKLAEQAERHDGASAIRSASSAMGWVRATMVFAVRARSRGRARRVTRASRCTRSE
jgi:hypothetical protein